MSARAEELKADLALVREAIREAVSGNRLAECTIRGRTTKFQVVGLVGLRELESSIARKLKKATRRRFRQITYNKGL